jgi:serine/threonine-protein kinase
MPVSSVPDLDRLAQLIPEQYKAQGQIIKGGMGAIFECRNRYTNAHVAVKLLHQQNTFDSIAAQRFVLEAKAATLLDHPNICRVLDFGASGGTPYLVMDWLDGISLQRKIDANGPLSVKEALPLFQQLAKALDHAHKHSVIHRDLKPDNIMLVKDGPEHERALIVDFGLAKVIDPELLKNEKLTQSGMIVGSPLYMSPEQCLAQPLDGRTDIYSLGCLMYTCLTGKPPFMGKSPVDILQKHLRQDPQPIQAQFKVPPSLCNIIMKMLEKETKDRYQSMEQLSTDLAQIAGGKSVPHLSLNVERRKAKNRVINVLFFVIAFAAMYCLSLALQNWHDAKTPEDSNVRELPKTQAPASEPKTPVPASHKHHSKR